MRITGENIQSILFGVAVGDALGVPVEFKSRSYLNSNPVTEMVGYGTYNQPMGTWSDDSTMTFCLAETLLDDEFSLHKLGNRFINWVDWGYWTPHGELFDIGNATSSAIDRLRTIGQPDMAGGVSEMENGNGSLMRILPLVIETEKMTISDSYNLIKSVSSLTHRHERSIISCFYYLTLARQLIHGHSRESSYEMTNAIVRTQLNERGISQEEQIYFNRILNGSMPTLDYSELSGSGYVVHSLESSIWCLLNSDSYSGAVLNAIHLGEDTDTTAAITGGISALAFGFNSIPNEWIKVLVKKDEIQDLANRLCIKYLQQSK